MTRQREDEAFEEIRRFLSYLPNSVWNVPPRRRRGRSSSPGRGVAHIVPRDRRHGYDVRPVVELVLDRNSFFEMTPYYGPPLVTGLRAGWLPGRRAGKRSVRAAVARQAGVREDARFIDLCDTFQTPAVNFVDQPVPDWARPRRQARYDSASARCRRFSRRRRPGRDRCARRLASRAPPMEYRRGESAYAWPSAIGDRCRSKVESRRRTSAIWRRRAIRRSCARSSRTSSTRFDRRCAPRKHSASRR